MYNKENILIRHFSTKMYTDVGNANVVHRVLESQKAGNKTGFGKIGLIGIRETLKLFQKINGVKEWKVFPNIKILGTSACFAQISPIKDLSWKCWEVKAQKQGISGFLLFEARTMNWYHCSRTVTLSCVWPALSFSEEGYPF